MPSERVRVGLDEIDHQGQHRAGVEAKHDDRRKPLATFCRLGSTAVAARPLRRGRPENGSGSRQERSASVAGDRRRPVTSSTASQKPGST